MRAMRTQVPARPPCQCPYPYPTRPKAFVIHRLDEEQRLDPLPALTEQTAQLQCDQRTERVAREAIRAGLREPPHHRRHQFSHSLDACDRLPVAIDEQGSQCVDLLRARECRNHGSQLGRISLQPRHYEQRVLAARPKALRTHAVADEGCQRIRSYFRGSRTISGIVAIMPWPCCRPAHAAEPGEPVRGLPGVPHTPRPP